MTIVKKTITITREVCTCPICGARHNKKLKKSVNEENFNSPIKPVNGELQCKNINDEGCCIKTFGKKCEVLNKEECPEFEQLLN